MPDKNIFLDLDICDSQQCKSCVVECDYTQHPKNIGITALRERIAFLQVCRRCEEAPCVNACPFDALEKQDDKVLKRYNMRCVSCKSCSVACPFGTIFPEVIPYLVPKCDFCINRAGDEKTPVCIVTCPYNALKFIKRKSLPEEDVYELGDYLVVRTSKLFTPEPIKSKS